MLKIKKKIGKIYEDNGLKITIEINLHIKDYQHITFNLKTGKSYSFTKQNISLQNTHRQSNSPSAIIKQILSMITKRVSDISSDKEHFDKAVSVYHEELKSWF